MNVSTVLLIATVFIFASLVLIVLSIDNFFLAQKFNKEFNFYINRALKYSRIASILSIVLIALDLIMGS